MKPIIISTSALQELEDAADYYEHEISGLSARFYQEIEKTLQFIQAYPNAGLNILTKYRRAHLRGFPYSIIYVEYEDTILVVAFAHYSRERGYWLK